MACPPLGTGGCPGICGSRASAGLSSSFRGMCWQLSRHHLKRGAHPGGVRGGHHLGHPGGDAQPADFVWGAKPAGAVRPSDDPPSQSLSKAPPLGRFFRGTAAVFCHPEHFPGEAWGFEGLVLCQLPAWLYQTDVTSSAGLPLPQLLEHRLLPAAPLVLPVTAPGISCGGCSPAASVPRSCSPPGCGP